MMFLDVDFYASLHDCLLNLWTSVVDGAYVFLDEYLNIPWRYGIFTRMRIARPMNTLRLPYPIPTRYSNNL
jgi:hypothetical protein